ncbi:hypothetical protein LCL95_09590 [Bacillus timonensis]|nr:hypothetical protein [Bacillus timonensis]
MLPFQITVLLLFILIGAIYARKEYRKRSNDEKAQIKEELKNPVSLLLSGLIYIGNIVLVIGIIFQSGTVQKIAFILIGLGLIITGAETWKESAKTGMVLVLLGSLTLLVTMFFVVWNFL